MDSYNISYSTCNYIFRKEEQKHFNDESALDILKMKYVQGEMTE